MHQIKYLKSELELSKAARYHFNREMSVTILLTFKGTLSREMSVTMLLLLKGRSQDKCL